MIRQYFISVAIASLTVACAAPSDDAVELSSKSSASEAPSEMVVDYPESDSPPGNLYPGWGACADHTRAPRAFVKLQRDKIGKEECPNYGGPDGEWVGTPVANAPGAYCSYEWKSDSFSEYFWLGREAAMSAVVRWDKEPLHLPFDALRADVRPDCSPIPSPCIRRDGSFDCAVIRDLEPIDIASNKGMSPCGACAEAISSYELLVILPDWFSAARTDEHPDVYIPVGGSAWGSRVLKVPQPKDDPAFIVVMKGLKPGQRYYVRRDP